MSENYRIDNLDQAILSALMENARLPYAELAKQPHWTSITRRKPALPQAEQWKDKSDKLPQLLR